MNQDPEVRMANSIQARLLNLEESELERIELRLQAVHPEVGAVDLRDVLEQRSDQLIERGIEWLEGLPWIGRILRIPLVGSFIKGKVRSEVDDYIPEQLEDDLAELAADLIGRIKL